MKWQDLLPLPLAAIALGVPLHAPRFRIEIPQNPLAQNDPCQYEGARTTYLQAYAYSLESPDLAIKLLHAAEIERKRCKGATFILADRITKLKRALSL